MLFLAEREVRQLLPMSVAIDLVRSSFEELAKGFALNQPRRRLKLDSGLQLHAMAGHFGEYLGTKVYTTHPRPTGNDPWASFLFLLFRASTGEPLAVFEANELGRIRTGAASGVATHLMANPGANVLGIIGAGYQARTQMHAICTVRKIREVRVYARRAESRKRFEEEFRAYDAGIVRMVDSPDQAAQGAGILVTATKASEPVISDDAVPEGVHINAIGSNQASNAELAAATLQRCSLIAVDSFEQAYLEAGDLLRGFGRGPWPEHQVCELADLVGATPKRKVRSSIQEITMFKSTGLGVQDVAVAGWVYERALQAGVGYRVPSMV
jgi:alanine dehydrogenase